METNEVQQSAQAAPTTQSQGISKEEAVRKLQEAQARRTAEAPQSNSGSLQANSGATGESGPEASPQTQKPTIEDKVAVKEAQAAKESGDQDSFARQFAALTRQQRQLFAQQEAIKKDMAEIEAFRKRQELKKTDLTKYLEEEGIDADSVLNSYLKKGEPPTVEDKVAQLEKKIADYEARIKAEQEQAQRMAAEAQEKAVVDNFRKQMNDFIKSKPEQYETILADEAFDQVFDVINRHFGETGEVLDFETAAEKVETQLFERAKKLTGLKKLSSHLAQKMPQQDTRTQTKPQAERSDEISFGQTLNSDFVPVSGTTVLKTMDAEELKKQAIAKLQSLQRQRM